MEKGKDNTQASYCKGCQNSDSFDIDFTLAFQPIVDIHKKSVYGYEALVRGINQEGASFVLSQLNDKNRYFFDQAIRIKAIKMAKKLNLQGMLSINFLPNAVYKPESCIRATLQAAREENFPTNQIIFEVAEGERIVDHQHLKNIFKEYKKQNFVTAIDDFGAGYAGLNLLADFQPDIIKLDMELTRNIDKDKVRRALVFAIVALCKELDIKIIAEGIETNEECLTLMDHGVNLFQGFLFAKPGFETLPLIPDHLWDFLKDRRFKDR